MEPFFKLYLSVLNRVQIGRVGRLINHLHNVFLEPFGYNPCFMYWSVILHKLEAWLVDLGYLIFQNFDI